MDQRDRLIQQEREDRIAETWFAIGVVAGIFLTLGALYVAIHWGK